ncbi:MAG: M48 family metalloprotease [Candidatus Micrarchaeaceae archaeon]
MASYFDEIASNKLKSIILFAVFMLLFLGIIYFFVILFGGGPIMLAIGFIIVLLYAMFSYFLGDKMVLRLSKAKEADKAKYQSLYSIVEGLAAASQLPMPKIYIINDQNPNAFATGKNRKASSIAVTSGLLAMMNRNELEGVLAHEMSHIYNNDILFMMMAVVFAGSIGLMSAFIRNIMFFGGIGGGRGRDHYAYLELIGFIIGLLAPLFALMLRLAISRRREYMADANGARLIRNPEALASALGKIQAYEKNPSSRPVAAANEINASLYFANPFKASSIMNLFSTHPPIEERIKRLKAMY